MNKENKEIVIFEKPQQAMAAHPLLGLGLLRQIDIDTYPGAARLNKSVTNATAGITFTVTIASPAVFTKTAHGLVAGGTIAFQTTGALPTGLSASLTYYVIAAGLAANTFEVSTTLGGAAVNTSGTQSGTHTYTTMTGVPYWIVRDPATGDLYSLNSVGQVHKSTDFGVTWATVVGETTRGTGEGLGIWKGYLFVARGTSLDLYYLTGATWTNAWQTLDSASSAAGTFHTMLASVDDKLYICHGRYVASVAELTTFDPANAATYTYTTHAITLATNYTAKCLADLGPNLMVGTIFGSSVLNHKVADIFPYNRSSIATLGIPVKLGENGVHALITVGNRLYAIAGLNAKIFLTDGTSAVQVSEISNYAISLLESGFRLDVFPGAVCYHRGKILFGFDNTGAVNGNVGVWALNLATKRLTLENIISTGNDGSTVEIVIGALYSVSRESYLIGWKDSTSPTTYGIDLKNLGATFVQSYGGVIETSLPQIGESLENRTIQSAEFFLTKPLVTGQGIRLKYRKDLTATFTTLATVDFATYGAIQSFNVSAAVITGAVFVQFRIELTSTGSDTPELVRAILKPSN